MKRLPLLLLAFASAAAAKPLPMVRSTDFVPNPAFLPFGGPHRADTAPEGAVEQFGEVVILEGDESLVSDDGQGSYGIVFNQAIQQPPAITQRFFTKYADEFDEIIVFTTFDDNGAQGALAYEISTQQDIKGLGTMLFNQTGPGGWGGSGGLHSFVNMMRWDQFSQMDGLDVTDPNSSLYTTLGQEFAHRWLAFLHFRDANGAVSDAMLGRDKAHWASTLQADASLMDGDRIVDNGDGTFTNAESFARYSMLDMYGMGLIDASEVPPWFLVANAVDTKGSKININYPMRVGKVIRGDRVDITIDDVISAEGPRVPGAMASPHAFRVAFVLLTRPGERAGDVTEIAKKIDQMRHVWEGQFAAFTSERGTMCTQVSAPCGDPTAKVISGSFTEIGGNRNGVIEPGEPVSVTFEVNNDSPAPAQPVAVSAVSDAITVSAAVATVDLLAPGETASVSFTGVIPKEAKCGERLMVRAESKAAGHTFRGFAEVIPGLAELLHRDFEDGPGAFAVNPDGKDSTTMNGWQIGTPIEYRGRSGWVFQPGTCHNDSNQCWFTGLVEGHRPMTDSSVGVGATSLWSPAFDVSKSYKPLLHYYAWFQALDFSNPQWGGLVADGIELVVEASADGGKTWVLLETIDGAEPSWRDRTVPLDGKLPLTGSIQVRFTASSPAVDQLVEAGIDDLQLITQTPACNPSADTGTPMTPENPEMPTPTGCACDVGARPSSPSAGLALLAAAALLTLLRRRNQL